MYESPGGEPLSKLLKSVPSTPTIPIEMERYVFDVLPPSLPPPRKALSTTLVDTPSPCESESSKNGCGKIPLLKPCTSGQEYTIMRPAVVKTERKPKPSPLVLQGLSTLPKV